ncbi:MAG TPA: recombinase family protein [Lachnospiraceae bacterium]|nr:recombinase family protein [Lachnospiraceae bacterium]
MGRNKDKGLKKKKELIRDRYQHEAEDLEIHVATTKYVARHQPGTILRVAAYCRVSTAEEEQTSSFELQVKTYRDLINSTPEYKLVNIYADEGISGTNLEHREGMQQMIEDCKAGKIDLILTKSMSRFARNVKDTLEILQELNNLPRPVEVKFETEHIDTFDPGNQVLLTMMASMAEQESRTKSDIMNWSFENRIKNGIFLTPPLYGYDQDENGNLVINPQEAKVVQFIYLAYIQGCSCQDIADILTSLGIRTYNNKEEWSAGTVRNIIRNERHCGDLIAHKTYTPDFLTHKHKPNHGERTWVKKEDHHEPIVSKRIWYAANRKMTVAAVSKSGAPMPALSVVDQGILKGFVPVDRNMRGFTSDDYSDATKSVYEENNHQTEAASDADIDATVDNADRERAWAFSGYQIARTVYFSFAGKNVLTLQDGKIRFNTTCMKEFDDMEYVEILLNTKQKQLAVRPCSSDSPTAIHWGRKDDEGHWKPSTMSCRGFLKPLCDLMNWAMENRYRFIGYSMKEEQEKCLIFDLTDPEITTTLLIEENSSDDDQDSMLQIITSKQDQIEKEASIHEEKVVSFADDGFGQDAVEAELEKVPFDGDWEILRPAKRYRYCCDITDEELSEIETDARRLMNELSQKAV